MEAKDSIKPLLCAKRQPPDMGLPSAAILWFCIETQAIHLDGWMLKYS